MALLVGGLVCFAFAGSRAEEDSQGRPSALVVAVPPLGLAYMTAAVRNSER
jgi:hypothetical protein